MRAKRDLTGEQENAAVEAEAALARADLPLPAKPRYKGFDGPPKLPLRVAELSDDELMRLFSALTNWNDYTSGQLALAEIEFRRLENKLAIAEATVLVLDERERSPGLRVARVGSVLGEEVQAFGPYLGGLQTRLAMAALHRVRPISYAGSRLTASETDLGAARGVLVGERHDVAPDRRARR